LQVLPLAAVLLLWPLLSQPGLLAAALLVVEAQAVAGSSCAST